jgi:hypothetical protein
VSLDLGIGFALQAMEQVASVMRRVKAERSDEEIASLSLAIVDVK